MLYLPSFPTFVERGGSAGSSLHLLWRWPWCASCPISMEATPGPLFRHSLESIGHELLLVIKAQACVNFPASALISHNGLFQNNFTIPKYSIITLIISVVIKKSAETQHLFELYHTFSLSLQAAWNSTIFIFVVPSSS